jgi:hypothetical protein
LVRETLELAGEDYLYGDGPDDLAVASSLCGV